MSLFMGGIQVYHLQMRVKCLKYCLPRDAGRQGRNRREDSSCHREGIRDVSLSMISGLSSEESISLSSSVVFLLLGAEFMKEGFGIIFSHS